MSERRDQKPGRMPDNKTFLSWLQTLPDAEQRYRTATSALEDYQKMVNQLSEVRAAAVADASQEDPVSTVARRFGISRQRAHQLLQQARNNEPAPVPRRRKARRKGSGKEQQ
jgi:hypothetical protein